MADNLLNASSILKVIGLYGLPAAGKTRLLGQLPASLGCSNFSYFEGSEVINIVVPGGLQAFKKANDALKQEYRCKSINYIKNKCISGNKVGITTGHFMFWEDETQAMPRTALTADDFQIYTHMIYLKTDPKFLAKRRHSDLSRTRQELSLNHLAKWQDAEIKLLTGLCRQHKILFIVITEEQPLNKTIKLISDFFEHDELLNLNRAKKMLDDAIQICGGDAVKTMLVCDADRTLSLDDASAMFWSAASLSCPLSKVFKSRLQYSYLAFRQVTLSLEEAADEQKFEEICERTASNIIMHKEIQALLERISITKHTTAVVITSGLRRVWELVLEKHGFANVKVIGGGRISDGLVVSDDVKAKLVEYLRFTLKMYVCAIGDSPLDLGMLKVANLAIVVVGPKDNRSKSMEAKLQEAINDGLEVNQVLLPQSSPKRDCFPLPEIQLDDADFLEVIFCCHVNVITADKNVAKLLMTPTRNTKIYGPDLRAAHQKIGFYLTVNIVLHILGLEQFEIPHVQGHMTDGFRIAGERSTTIIALMRGGESMAFGVNEAMPQAMFVHAYKLEDVQEHHLKGQSTIVLVDSVVNTGKSIAEIIIGLREKSTALIIVICGVVQQEAVCDVGRKRATLAKALSHLADIIIVALRVSENKYTGTGTTDTGNRLFNTPQIL